jgi:hypothetical protein
MNDLIIDESIPSWKNHEVESPSLVMDEKMFLSELSLVLSMIYIFP